MGDPDMGLAKALRMLKNLHHAAGNQGRPNLYKQTVTVFSSVPAGKEKLLYHQSLFASRLRGGPETQDQAEVLVWDFYMLKK